MCGRVKLSTDVTELVRDFDFRNLPNVPTRYNVAPTQQIAVVRRAIEADGRELALLRWRLIPYWMLLANAAGQARSISSREARVRAGGRCSRASVIR